MRGSEWSAAATVNERGEVETSLDRQRVDRTNEIERRFQMARRRRFDMT